MMRRRRASAARLWWLVLPWLVGISGCSTGRPPTTPASHAPAWVHHIVRPGETLAAIGRRYGLPWQTLAQVNGLADPHHLEVGQALWVPAPPDLRPPAAASLAAPMRVGPEPSLQWPAIGTLTSGFGRRGRRFHSGIDISAEAGTPIVAAADGVVVFSGRGPDGYGNTVMLDHGRSIITLYAHNQRNLVRVGERVRRGQPIALMGDTGRASGTHLHFEVHQNGQLIDPRHWLR
jgi:lipoprotein NlpD